MLLSKAHLSAEPRKFLKNESDFILALRSWAFPGHEPSPVSQLCFNSEWTFSCVFRTGFVEIMFQVPALNKMRCLLSFPALHWHKETGDIPVLFCIFLKCNNNVNWLNGIWVKDTIISSLAQFPTALSIFSSLVISSLSQFLGLAPSLFPPCQPFLHRSVCLG